jgi:hypothetical protein
MTARVVHAPPSSGFQPPLPLPAACFEFSDFCACVFNLVCLRSQLACVWIKFYENICMQIARSAIFL